MKKTIVRIAIAVAVLAVLGVIALVIFLDAGVKKGIETVGPMVTKVPVKVEGVILSPFSGSGTIKGFVLGNPEGFKTANAMSVGTSKLAVQPGSILSDKIVVNSIVVEAPVITYETDLKSSNLGKIQANLESLMSTNEPAQDEAASRKLQVDEFKVTGGSINVSVTALGGKSVTVPLPDIHLTDLGKGPEGITAAELTKRLLDIVIAKAIESGGKAVVDLGNQAIDAGKQVGDNAVGSVRDATKGITDMFKKKPSTNTVTK